jgi:hypothetical protein
VDENNYLEIIEKQRARIKSLETTVKKLIKKNIDLNKQLAGRNKTKFDLMHIPDIWLIDYFKEEW